MLKGQGVAMKMIFVVVKNRKVETSRIMETTSGINFSALERPVTPQYFIGKKSGCKLKRN